MPILTLTTSEFKRLALMFVALVSVILGIEYWFCHRLFGTLTIVIALGVSAAAPWCFKSIIDDERRDNLSAIFVYFFILSGIILLKSP